MTFFRRQSINRFAKYSLFALVSIIPFSTAAVEILFGVSLVLYILRRATEKDWAIQKNVPLMSAAAFIFFLFLSIFASGTYFHKSMETFVFKWLEYVLIFFIIQDSFRSREDRVTAFRLIFIAAAITSIDGIIQRFLGFDLFRFFPLLPVKQSYPGQPTVEFQAITAAFDHSNPLGNYLMACGLLAVGWADNFRKPFRSPKVLLTWGGVFLIISALALTLSRASWLAFAGGLLVYGLLCRSFKRLAFFILILVGALCHPMIQSRLAFTFTSPHGGSERMELWSLAGRMIWESPWLGKGVGTFMDYASAYSGGAFARYAHNGYLQIWAESGVFALASFLIFALILIFRGLKALKQPQTDRGLIAGLIACWTGLLIHNFFDVHLYGLRTAVLFWTIAGLLVCFTRETPPIQTGKELNAR